MVFMEKWKNGEKCTKEIQGVLYSLQSNKVHNYFVINKYFEPSFQGFH